MNSLIAMTDFVDLSRCFVKIRKDQEPNLDIGRVWGRKIGGWLEWTDLLKCRRVVLLAEASSGKTEEFRNKAIAVSNGGQEAFFVRIEELADQDFERALDLTALQRFLQWREATEPGWFFLDSVDEARLNRKSFEAALRRFARELGQSLSRAHVLISCRVTDWKGREDRIAIERLLPIGVSESAKAAEKDEESSLLDPIFERETGTKKQHVKESDEHSSDETVVVQLVPLSAEQRRSLASASGINDCDTFTSSIDRNGLDILAERPGDLLDLAEYWKTFGCFGRFEVMVEHGVTQKLAERDKYRPDNDALTPQQARQGAERIVQTVLDDIQSDLLNADASSRCLLGTALDEKAVQNWLAEQLRLRRRDRFHVYREAEVARGDLPDIVVASTAAPVEVALEVKHCGKDWTLKNLDRALRHQLAEDYLKPESRRHGILILTQHGNRAWRDPNTGETIAFQELVQRLRTIASTLLENETGPIEVHVAGLDASPLDQESGRRPGVRSRRSSGGSSTNDTSRGLGS